jgi:hypothetical protein
VIQNPCQQAIAEYAVVGGGIASGVGNLASDLLTGMSVEEQSVMRALGNKAAKTIVKQSAVFRVW